MKSNGTSGSENDTSKRSRPLAESRPDAENEQSRQTYYVAF
jgi:hypothetical protein